MKINYTATLNPDQCDLNSFRDVITEVGLSLELDLSRITLQQCFDLLPEHIKLDAINYGLSDIVFRDNAYTIILNCIDALIDILEKCIDYDR